MALGFGIALSAQAATTPSGTTQVSGSTFVVMAVATGTITGVIDNKSNVYLPVTAQFAGGDNGRLYACENAVGGTGHTFTAQGTGVEGCAIIEITSDAGSSTLDQQNGNVDSASPYTSPSITTLQAIEMLISGFVGNSGSNPATHAESTGFTIPAAANQTNGSAGATFCMGYRAVASAGGYNSSFTETGASGATAVMIASYSEAVAGGGPQPYIAFEGHSPGFITMRRNM